VTSSETDPTRGEDDDPGRLGSRIVGGERTADMTVEIRRDKEIYGTDGGWFQARWHFSFDHYYDPRQMGVGAQGLGKVRE
jgi:hypothetical protein